MKDLVNKYKRLVTAYDKASSASRDMETALTEKVDFLYYIDYLSSDGFILGNQNTADVAPLATCLGIIKYKGFLTEEDHKKECI